METRANYLLIGAFTLAGILGVLGALLWLAKVEVSRQYAYYDVLFENVSGLATAADVRFNGLQVGQVVALDLDEEDPSKVRVRIEVDAETPIKTDTEAQLLALGVTGVSYVSLSGGSPGAGALPEFGEIDSRRSPLQSIFEGAPELLNKAILLLEDVQSVVNEENRQAITEVLDNLASASGRLDSTLSDFETLSDDLGLAAREIADFTGRLEELADTAETTLTTATDTLNSAKTAADNAVGTLDSANEAFATADTLMKEDLTEFIQKGTEVANTLDSTVKRLEPTVLETVNSAQQLISERLPNLTDQVQSTAATIETQVATLGEDAGGLITRYNEVGERLSQRLAEAESAIAAFEATTTEVRATFETVNGTVEENLPALMDEVRATAQSAKAVIEGIGTDVNAVTTELGGLSDEAEAALTTATDTFANANETLASITTAMDRATQTLDTADATFSSVNNIIDEDLDAIVADVRGAVGTFSDTVASVAVDVDKVSEEILSASNSASDLLGTVDGIVQDNRRQVSDFLRVGLPQIQRFIEESRRLVVNLERLVDRVERDPARFLLGTQAREFGR